MKAALASVITLMVVLAVPAQAQNRARSDAPPPAAEPSAAPAPPPQQREPTVDPAELLARIGEQTNMEFVIDPRLPRGVYIGDTPPNEVTYPMLLSILRVHGWFAAEIDGRTFILPNANARQMPLRLLQRDDPNVSDHEYVTRVLRVSGEDSPRAHDDAGRELQWSARAGVLVPVLRVLMSVEGHLAAAGDHLILIDRYDNVRRMTAIIDALDQ